MDLVGPKYLSGGFRFYFLNIIDIETHFAGVYPIKDKTCGSIAKSLIHFWQIFGMPDFLQMDNELSFRGSNRYPRSLGLVLRLLLSLRINPIFIPPSEPWRNGIIEKFNDNMLKYFFCSAKFSSIEELEQKASDFSLFHNQNHHYSSQNGKTPCQMKEEVFNQFKLTQNIDLEKPIPLLEGTVVFIRFIRSNRILKILESQFEMKKELIYTYVIAKIIVEKHILVVIQDNIIQHIFPFEMPVDW